MQLQCKDISADVTSASGSDQVGFAGITGLKRMFPNSFDTMGDFKGPNRLVSDPTVIDVHPNRKYAIRHKLAIKQELSKMEMMGVIAKITKLTD